MLVSQVSKTPYVTNVVSLSTRFVHEDYLLVLLALSLRNGVVYVIGMIITIHPHLVHLTLPSPCLPLPPFDMHPPVILYPPLLLANAHIEPRFLL